MTLPNVLFVDDEEMILKAVKRDLRQQPYNVRTALGPDEAMAVLDSEPIAVVVSDHRMPKMTGIEFLIQVKAKFPEITRVVLTGQADLGMVIRAINEGSVYHFLTKPWERDELRVALMRIVEHTERIKQLKAAGAQLPAGVTAEQLEDLESSHPGISTLKKTRTGAIEISPDDADPELLKVLSPH